MPASRKLPKRDKRPLPLKAWTRRAHMLLGLAAGTVVLVVGITGATLAFEREIRDAIEPYRFTAADGEPLPPSRLITAAEKAVPGKSATRVTYPEAGQNVAVEFYRVENATRIHWLIAYVEPTTGKVSKVVDRLNGFDIFQFALNGHVRLWLPDAIGRDIVSHATFVFVLLLVSGIILWWPRHKAALRQRVVIKWRAGVRRRLFDLHAVTGFYASIAALVIALTGLAWSYEWIANAVYRAASGGKTMTPWSRPVSDTTAAGTFTEAAALDSLWRRVRLENNPSSLEIVLPKTASDAVQAYANPDQGVYFRGDYRFFDRYTLREMPVKHSWGRYTDASFADRLQRMYYDLHVGAILGLPGKFIAFMAALVAAGLPVTGFLMWRTRRTQASKSRTNSRQQRMPS